jgi:hypothetical protein
MQRAPTTSVHPPNGLFRLISIHGKIGTMQRQQKITLGEMLADNGPRLLIVYCADVKCSHSVIVSSELWPDHMRLSDLEPKLTCRACGCRGADVRPLFERTRMGP